MNTTSQQQSQFDSHTGQTPVYPSGLSRLPQPLLIEPVEVDAALAKLMGAPAKDMIGLTASRLAGTGARRSQETSQAEKEELDTSMAGVEVTEHPLPEGIDFAAFHALLRLAH